MTDPYTGKFCISDFFIPGRDDFFTIMAIVERLGKVAELEEIQDALYARLHEGEEDESRDRTPRGRPGNVH